MEFDIAVLPGDGIGPEVVAEATKVLQIIGEKFGHVFHLHQGLIGGAAIDAFGTALKKETFDMCRERVMLYCLVQSVAPNGMTLKGRFVLVRGYLV